MQGGVLFFVKEYCCLPLSLTTRITCIKLHMSFLEHLVAVEIESFGDPQSLELITSKTKSSEEADQNKAEEKYVKEESHEC